MRRLCHTILNMIYPDPRGEGLHQAMEQLRLDREVPWKRSDWVALAILTLALALVYGFWPEMMMPQ
jgi:hypothetical protein